jgi:hypothetical protein
MIMVRTHYPTTHGCGAQEKKKKMGILKYGFNYQASPDKLHEYINLVEKHKQKWSYLTTKTPNLRLQLF